ncbi:cytochrome P460 family protein [Thiosocius teredinicola]|uniref:cytochrome P460 family protein n=1 Tax=Thiosocius teredinicola TaxID=1973002 RepID=UPI000F778080
MPLSIRSLMLGAMLWMPIATLAAEPAANGLLMPEDYKDWRVISSSHRTDHKSLRVILGNDIAVKAAREGNTNPWPDGAILGKVVWKEKVDPHWAAAIVPGDFSHAEFMYKDSKKWAANDGWGYARWVGTELKPYGNDATAAQAECIACHTPVKDRDWVFTTPAVFP